MLNKYSSRNVNSSLGSRDNSYFIKIHNFKSTSNKKKYILSLCGLNLNDILNTVSPRAPGLVDFSVVYNLGVNFRSKVGRPENTGCKELRQLRATIMIKSAVHTGMSSRHTQ